MTIGGVTAAVFISADAVGLRLLPLGYANLVFADLLIGWYLLDVFVPRRNIYQWFGEVEDPIKLALRFWRKVLLMTSGLAGLAAMSFALYRPSPQADTVASSSLLTQNTLGPLFILTGIFIAALGWMYTGFEKEKADRASNTLQAIRDQLYGDHVSGIYAQVIEFCTLYRKSKGLTFADPIPLEAMTMRLGELTGGSALATGAIEHPDRPPRGKNPPHETGLPLKYLATQFLNALDQLALGVRQGQLDLHTIDMVMRPRFVRNAFSFAPYIERETDAKPDSRGRLRARNRTWEHFLWLTSKLELLESDNIDPKVLTLPPNHIVGSKVSEKAMPPESSAATSVQS